MARGELADESQGDCEWVSESEGQWRAGAVRGRRTQGMPERVGSRQGCASGSGSGARA